MLAPPENAAHLDRARHFIGAEIPFDRELGLRVVALEEGAP